MIETITHRHELGRWLTQNKMLGRGAEIGVLFGAFSEVVLKEWRGLTFFMVDCWVRQPINVYRERTSDINYDKAFREATAVAQRYPNAQILRMDSLTAARSLPDNSLDWVYIDANHSYTAVLADMDAWFPKLRPGGLFAGHDYGLDTNFPHWNEVKPAVDRWMAEHQIKFRVTHPCDSWWSIKPEEKSCLAMNSGTTTSQPKSAAPKTTEKASIPTRLPENKPSGRGAKTALPT